MRRTRDVAARYERDVAGRECPWYPPPADLEDAIPGPPAAARIRNAALQAGWLLIGLAAAALFLGGYAFRALVAWPLSEPETPRERHARIVAAILPEGGVSTRVPWGDTLAKLVESGVIDPAAFAAALERGGHPVTPEQQQVLRGDSEAFISIDRESAHFVLNALWAVGIANQTFVLTEGPMWQLAPERRSALASTGGWSLGKRSGGDILASLPLTNLTGDQAAVLRQVAFSTYRPCCDNPTAFPDCNHGAAALGLAELMAAGGASADEMYTALKAFNSFWFPDQFYVIALYFDRQGMSWPDVKARDVLSAPFASKSGWTAVARQVQEAGGNLGGGGCAA